MTRKNKEEEAKTVDANEQYRKEFADLPLEQKISNLVQLEAIALGETISFVLNSPFKIAEKVMDVMAEFGFKMDSASRDARRPNEHKTNGAGSGSETGEKKARKKAGKTDKEEEKAEE
jgi:hypothetical protein